MKAMVSKPYAKVLREAFPNATFVGFTGTPIAETYQTFGDEIDRYTMDQAVADGLTVSIKYHPRIAKVLLDEEKVKQIEDYYRKCADEGATSEDIEASKKAMSSMEKILDEPGRLERLAVDIHVSFLFIQLEFRFIYAAFIALNRYPVNVCNPLDLLSVIPLCARIFCLPHGTDDV